MTKVVLRPLNVNNWAGVVHYKNCYRDLAPYLLKNGKRYTGFESDNEDEQKELDKEKKKLEKELRTELHSESSFWDTFFIRTRDEDIVLNDNDPYDRLKIRFLERHMEVKHSLSEKKAGAAFVMIDEEKEARIRNLKADDTIRAYEELKMMTVSDVRDALRLYGVRSEDISEEIAREKLIDYIEQDPTKFLRIWVDNKGRKTQVVIEKAITKGIVRRTNLMYLYGTTNLGKSMNEVIAFIESEDGQDVKLGILSSIKD